MKKKAWVLLGIIVLFFSCMKKMELLTLVEVKNRTLSFSDVTESSVTVRWDTDSVIDHRNAGPLEYKVVYSLTNNIQKLNEIEVNGIVVMDWTANVNSYTITGLNVGTIYYVNVVVRNQMGNKNRFEMGQVKITKDNPPTISNSILVVDNVTMNSFRVNWNAATDDITASTDLSYLVYYSTNDNITSIIDAETNGIPVGNYEKNITSKTITNLNLGTTYYFTVIVKDGAGNKAIYTKNSVTTVADTTPPFISNATLTASDIMKNSFTVNWNAATDNVTASTNLQYLVRYSFSDNISTLVQAEANGIPVGSYEANITSKTITGLNPGTTYYFTVIVKDESGNRAIYTKNSVTTKKPGDLDTTFNPVIPANGIVRSVVSLSDGKLLIGGSFTNYTGTTRKGIARINTNGTLDNSFGSTDGVSDNSTVYSVAIDNEAKIFIGGDFTTYNGTTRNRIARLNSDGSLDTSFNPGSGPNSSIYSVVIQNDGGVWKILIGGSFTSYAGTTKKGIARLGFGGTLDTSFNFGGEGANDTVYAIAVDSSGKILIGGVFTNYNGTSRNYIARLNSNGTLDTSFNLIGTGINNTVYAIAVDSSGKILIGGAFTNYNGTSRNYIARLNSNGSLDTSFNPGSGADGIIYSIAIQSDGKILIGGAFTSYNGQQRNGIARLNSDGSLDTNFNPGAGIGGISDPAIYSIAIQSDGRILIGGKFMSYDNNTQVKYLARIWGGN